MKRKLLDISKLRTVKDLNDTDFSKFASSNYSSWLKHTVSPVSMDDLNRVCGLSTHKEAEVDLYWNMGDLYYKKPSEDKLSINGLVKEEKVKFEIEFTVDMNNEETDDFLLYFEERINEGLLNEELIMEEDIPVRRIV